MAKYLHKEKREVFCYLLDEKLERDDNDRFNYYVLGPDLMRAEDSTGCVMSIPKDFQALNSFLFYIKEEFDSIGIEVLKVFTINENIKKKFKIFDNRIKKQYF